MGEDFTWGEDFTGGEDFTRGEDFTGGWDLNLSLGTTIQATALWVF